MWSGAAAPSKLVVCRIRPATAASKATGCCPRPMPRTILLHGVAISRVSGGRSATRRSEAVGVVMAFMWFPPAYSGGDVGRQVGGHGPVAEPFVDIGLQRALAGLVDPVREVRKLRHCQAQEMGASTFEHLECPVQPFDAFAIDRHGTTLRAV